MNTHYKTLGDRMKEYEEVAQGHLMRRTPVIIRLDGKAFRNFTHGRTKPFDLNFALAMQFTTQYLVKNIQGCKFGYTQSDEISLLLTDYDTFETEAWFGYRIQKMISTASSQCTQIFNKYIRALDLEDQIKKIPKDAFFDARVFNLSKEEVGNYFVWRQQDCRRNSISAVAQAHYSPRELHNMKTGDRLGLLKNKGIDYDRDIDAIYRNGAMYCSNFDYEEYVRKETNCIAAPNFKEDREVIDTWVYVDANTDLEDS